jgi:hypothetical protein
MNKKNSVRILCHLLALCIWVRIGLAWILCHFKYDWINNHFNVLGIMYYKIWLEKEIFWWMKEEPLQIDWSVPRHSMMNFGGGSAVKVIWCGWVAVWSLVVTMRRPLIDKRSEKASFLTFLFAKSSLWAFSIVAIYLLGNFPS